MNMVAPRPGVHQPLRPPNGGGGAATDEELDAAVQRCKRDGNAAFRAGDYVQALTHYSETIAALLEKRALLRSLKQEQRGRLVSALADAATSPAAEQAAAKAEEEEDGRFEWTFAATDPLVVGLQAAVSEKERKHATKDVKAADRALLAAIHSNGAEALHRIGQYDHALRWALAALAIDPTHKKAKARLLATRKNETRLSSQVADVARQTAQARNREHAERERKQRQAAADVGSRREAITNSQAKKERAPAAAAERERAEAAIATVVRAERKQESARRRERATRAAARLREIHHAPPLSEAALARREPIWVQQPGKRPRSAPATRHRVGVEAFCAGGGGDRTCRRGEAAGAAAPDGFLNVLFKPARAADAATRAVRKQEGRTQGALNRQVAKAGVLNERNAKLAAIGARTAAERVAAYQAVEQRRQRRAERNEEHGARHVLQSYSSQDDLRGVANKAKRERAAKMASKRCWDTVQQRDQRADDAKERALIALAGGESEEAAAERRAAAKAAKAAAAADAEAKRLREVAEAHEHQRKNRSERASGNRSGGKVSRTKEIAAANAMNKARDGQPIFDAVSGRWTIFRAAEK